MKKVMVILLAVLLVGALGAAAFWYVLEQKVSAFVVTAYGSAEPKVVEIPPGTNPKGVANLLAKANVVSNADSLYAYLKRDKLGPKLKAGEYEFQGELTPAQVIEKLLKGEVKTYHFTVAEGLRVDEILPIVAASELKLSLDKLKALAGTPEFVKKTGVPADTFEGFLFPDTYTFPRGATEESVLTKMASRTLEEFKRATRKPGVELDLLQGITLASIVEKETGANEPEARPHIACVFHNRLRLKMRLDTDPTVIYAKMLITGTYSKNITRKDLETDHPYNTYRNKGLPPGPIASPGRAAIEAALNPLTCDDLFFVSRNDGTSIFCPDLKCHEANVQKYQVAPFKKEGDEPKPDPSDDKPKKRKKK